MGKKEVFPNRQYTNEFKFEAVRLAESVGGNEAAKRLGIPDSSLWNWVRLSRAGKLRTVDGATAVPAAKRSLAEAEAENARLRRELASTKLDLEIVKKAAAYFAKESR
jgi:transposase